MHYKLFSFSIWSCIRCSSNQGHFNIERVVSRACDDKVLRVFIGPSYEEQGAAFHAAQAQSLFTFSGSGDSVTSYRK